MTIDRNKIDNPILGYDGNNSTPVIYPGRTGRVFDEDSEMYAGFNGHYGYPNFPPDRNVGGRFFLNKYERSAPPVSVGKIDRCQLDGTFYRGAVNATFIGVSKLNGTSWSPSSTQASDAWNRMKPTQPNFSGLNAVYELKDVPGMLKQRLSHNGLKDIGSYYLALKFGWEPLLRDIRDFVKTQMSAQKRLQQLLRDNGKPVRRGCTLYDISTTSYSEGASYGALNPVFATQFYKSIPLFRDTVTTTERIWASGRYRYWLPGGPRDVAWQRKMIARIFGFKPSPKVVWDALPWTWLIDWFVDVGSMLENMEAGVADRLAADYFYIMYNKTITGRRESRGFFKKGCGSTQKTLEVQAVSTVIASHKAREVGDPFGWNTPENTLSGNQLSILGALGLSRLR